MSIIDNDKLPVHIGFIMDGNGRWAQKRNMPRKMGHRAGAETFRKIVKYCKEKGIKYVTFYAFSTENWKRPEDEVSELMKLFNGYLDEVKEYTKENIRLIFLGDKSAFGAVMARKMIEIEEYSKKFDGMTLMLAMNYGGRDDIVHAVKQLSEMAVNKEIKVEDIDEKILSSMLYTKGLPDVDLLIRPSG